METWKNVKGFEIYQVSNRGRVKSLKFNKEKILKTRKVKGYEKVNLFKNHLTTTHYVHRLVAKAFIPNPDSKPFINHVNSVKTDNRADNLTWADASENGTHGWKSKRVKSPKQGISRKFSNSDIRDMRKRFEKGETITSIADRYKLNQRSTSDIVHKRSYKHVN